ncbi:MAG: hypothetical protein ACQEVA_06090 [Myxococcota bacterium]
MSSQDFEASIARLTRRVDAALAQSRRFDELADRVRQWADNWSVEAIGRWLDDGGPATEEADRALVALALKGTAAAGERLRAHDAAAGGATHELLWQVALIEWERRHDVDYYESAG